MAGAILTPPADRETTPGVVLQSPHNPRRQLQWGQAAVLVTSFDQHRPDSRFGEPDAIVGQFSLPPADSVRRQSAVAGIRGIAQHRRIVGNAQKFADARERRFRLGDQRLVMDLDPAISGNSERNFDQRASASIQPSTAVKVLPAMPLSITDHATSRPSRTNVDEPRIGPDS